jgi:hypothetical protein
LSYSPRPGSNIAQIYACISGKPQTKAEIIAKLQLQTPKFPAASVPEHLRFLIDKALIVNNDGLFSKPATTSKPPTSKSQCYLTYCKKHIGKQVKSKDLATHCCNGNTADTGPAGFLSALAAMNGATRVDEIKPYRYLILPEIKLIDKVTNTKLPATKPPQETQQNVKHNDNIADLSIGQILSEYVSMKDENRRLRAALQRIAHELYEVGEVRY